LTVYTAACRSLAWLSPSIFFHPLWVNFNISATEATHGLIRKLLPYSQQYIAQSDPNSACEIYFLCAAIKKGAGNYTEGLHYTKQAWQLASQYQLNQIRIWAAWGSCALWTNLGNYGQAANQLEWLRENLRATDDWTLANMVWLAEANLLEQKQGNREQEFIMDWLVRWGESPIRIAAPYLNGNSLDLPEVHLSPPGPAQRTNAGRRSFWQTLQRILKGKVRLQWVEQARNSSPPTPHLSRMKVAKATSRLNSKHNHTPATPSQEIKAGEIASEQQPTASQGGEASPNEIYRTSAPEKSSTDLPEWPHKLIAPDDSTPPSTHTITAYFLGSFHVFIDDQPVDRWPSSRGRSILKYLLFNYAQAIPREVLMEVFWPHNNPEAARNNLNVAIYGLRQAFRAITKDSLVEFHENKYGLASGIKIWIDVEEFDRHLRLARQLEAKDHIANAIKEYEIAASLYQGDFLAGDPYEEWSVFTREQLRISYLDTLDRLSRIYFGQSQYTACVTLCQQILERDNCREDAHRLLMRSYSRLGQHHLALRQYKTCVEALLTELDVVPAPATVELAARIRRREQI